MKRIVYFVHHQGRGHAQRFAAIAEHLPDRLITVLCAEPDLIPELGGNVEIVALPNMIGDVSVTDRLADEQTPPSFHCLPLGSRAMTEAGRIISDVLTRGDTGLFISDVSAEWSILSRLLSVPSMKIRMHGDRDDPCHRAAYEASIGLIAPFAEELEQSDFPLWARNKTFYAGGLCTAAESASDRNIARRKLGLPSNREIIVVMAGGGGSGTPYAPITMGARARPQALWLTVGRLSTEGHETDFPNLERRGWVDNVGDYLAAADTVIASAGDNTVHEIARIGRPFLCVPEWRYFNEQVRKAECLDALGAAAVRFTWPASSSAWNDALNDAGGADLGALKRLYSNQAGRSIAEHVERTIEELWSPRHSTIASSAA